MAVRRMKEWQSRYSALAVLERRRMEWCEVSYCRCSIQSGGSRDAEGRGCRIVDGINLQEAEAINKVRPTRDSIQGQQQRDRSHPGRHDGTAQLAINAVSKG